MSTTLNSHFNQPGIGLGCMNLSHAYGTPLPEADAIQALRQAFDMGYRHFDTATLYGGGRNETVVGKALKDQRQSLFLASKCGMAIGQESGKKEIDGRPDTLRAQCEASLRRLQTDHIDLYYLHRLDPNTPIEDSVGALSDLVREGKIGAIGLSEVSAATLKRAQRVHPIAALQTEYSLWSRNAEIAVLDACRESGTAFVAFSPLARGFLTNTLLDVDTLCRKGYPQQHAPLLQGELSAEPEPAGGICCNRSTKWAAHRHSWHWPGFAPRATLLCRFRAPVLFHT